KKKPSKKRRFQNPKSRSAKIAELLFKTMAFSHTDQLNQLDPKNEREFPLKLTPHSPWGRQKKQVCFSLHAQKCLGLVSQSTP
ncbi:hypothetical protein L3V67_11465, partial [Levilactobacillus sp. HBUAS51416]|nr:hypothetical protein [Levilactobacillus tujiorum]